MKRQQLTLGLLLFLLCVNINLNAQHWKLGGNSGFPPPDALNPTNNLLGSSTGNNVALRVGTNGINRIKVNENLIYSINGFPSTTYHGYTLIGQDGTGS